MSDCVLRISLPRAITRGPIEATARATSSETNHSAFRARSRAAQLKLALLIDRRVELPEPFRARSRAAQLKPRARRLHLDSGVLGLPRAITRGPIEAAAAPAKRTPQRSPSARDHARPN